MHRNMTQRRGFTLVELLVVIAVVGLLISVLLPALGSARAAARGAQSASNMRQIVTAFMAYATDYNQKFPTILEGITDPETDKLNMHWYDENRIGQFLPQFDESNLEPTNPKNNTVGGGVFVSPSHTQGGRSYTMNFWGASAASYQQIGSNPDRFNYFKPGNNPLDAFEGRRGQGFNPTSGRAADLLLIGEAWGIWPSENPDFETKWFTEAQIGREGLPGERFGAGEVTINAGANTNLWVTEAAPEMGGISGNTLPTYIPWYRHPRIDKDPLTRNGSAHFAFMDGHVELLKTNEVANDATGRSSYQVLWSLRDKSVEDEFLGEE